MKYWLVAHTILQKTLLTAQLLHKFESFFKFIFEFYFLRKKKLNKKQPPELKISTQTKYTHCAMLKGKRKQRKTKECAMKQVNYEVC